MRRSPLPIARGLAAGPRGASQGWDGLAQEDEGEPAHVANRPWEVWYVGEQDFDLDHAFAKTVKLLKDPGVLLCGVNDIGKANLMAIGWATFGIVWGRPVATVFVRPSRYTYEFLESIPDFSINVMHHDLSDAVTWLGTVSGRDCDKLAECGLTLAPARQINTPVVEQAIIKYECSVIHRNDVVRAALSRSVAQSYYPRDDYHRIYYGEIVECYGPAK